MCTIMESKWFLASLKSIESGIKDVVEIEEEQKEEEDEGKNEADRFDENSMEHINNFNKISGQDVRSVSHANTSASK